MSKDEAISYLAGRLTAARGEEHKSGNDPFYDEGYMIELKIKEIETSLKKQQRL